MSFLNPFMLLGIGAISVPIIIHLLNRRKFKRVAWAAMRFLKVSVEQNQRRMRIEDLLLLILRCLLLALLAIALARPALLSDAGDLLGQSKVTAVIILDNSYSMAMSDGAQTRFDRARAAAEQAIDSMPGGSAAAVFLASDIVNDVVPLPTFDLNLARKTVRDAALTDRSTDLFPALDAAVKLLTDRMAVRKEIFLVTDGQGAGWRQLPEIQRTLEKSKGDIATHIVLVGDSERRNLGVSALRLTSGLAPARQPLRFEVKVSNYGEEEARNIRVGLGLDNDPPSDEFTIDSLPAGTTKSISLFGKFRTEGFHSVTARIPGDRLAADDYRSLAVRTLREVKVLLIDGDPGNESRESETFFLGHALTPVAPELQAEYFIRTTRITTPEIAQVRFDDFDAIVLANVPDFPGTAVVAFESYLRRGGGLLIFPGDRINRNFYNDQLLLKSKILPAKLGERVGDAGQDEVFVTFQEKNYEHPMVELWNDPAGGTLASARFFRRCALELPVTSTNAPTSPASRKDEAGEPRLILSYNDGSAAVVERDWGLGRVILFSSSGDTAWNDFPVRPSFVPLLHRALGLIVQRQDEGLNLRVGEKFVRRIPMEYLEKDAVYVRPQHATGGRELRRIELVDSWPLLQYTGTDWSGLYETTVADPVLNLKFAAQPNAYESDLEPMSAAQRTTLQEVAQVIAWSPGMELRGMMQKQRSGLEFWLPLVVASLMVAAGETFLAQWFSRSK